eukprot:RCo039991
MAGIPPQQTLYVSNLNDKLQKEELRLNLYMLFSQFGPIMDIVATKVIRLRGQAFVVFKDINASTTAMRQLQGMFFFDKPMRIQYARTKSDSVARFDGTYSAKKKRERKEKERLQEKERLAKLKRKDQLAIGDRESKRKKVDEEMAVREREREKERQRLREEEAEEPHNTLFVENLPPEATENPQMLSVLFQNFEGFHEVRVPPGARPIAFVEFDSVVHARDAKMALQNFKITQSNTLKISFGKKG